YGKRYAAGTALKGQRAIYAPGNGADIIALQASPSLNLINDPALTMQAASLALAVKQALGVQDPAQVSGKIIAANSVTITGAVDSRGGMIEAGNLVDVEGKRFWNDAIILADGRVVQGSVKADNILIA